MTPEPPKHTLTLVWTRSPDGDQLTKVQLVVVDLGAVPSMLMVAPTGRTKRAICRST